MMQKMMADMMEKCKSDTAMMCTMCRTMMGSKEMMDMMEKMKEGNNMKQFSYICSLPIQQTISLL
jgi:NADH:ubiquinone oxidoreductase subunit F (NADH-binding)